jgi:hypothetical protein
LAQHSTLLSPGRPMSYAGGGKGGSPSGSIGSVYSGREGGSWSERERVPALPLAEPASTALRKRRSAWLLEASLQANLLGLLLGAHLRGMPKDMTQGPNLGPLVANVVASSLKLLQRALVPVAARQPELMVVQQLLSTSHSNLIHFLLGPLHSCAALALSCSSSPALTVSSAFVAPTRQ